MVDILGCRICIFGDSVTWGANDFEKGGWVNRLRIYSDKYLDDFPVYNLGVSGDSTNELLERFELECRVRRPEVIIFSIGLNDSMFVKDKNDYYVTIKRFKENLGRLISLAKVYSQKIIFMGLTKVDESKTTPIPWELTLYYENENIKKYDVEIKTIADKNNLIYIELYGLLKVTDLDDGLHANAKGHEKIFQKVKSVLFDNKYIC